MMKHIRLVGIVFLFLFIVASIRVQQASALTLLNASASASTSRPSPSAPLSVDHAAGVSTVTILNNTSTFLSSDSATFFNSGTPDLVRIATTSANRLSLFLTANTTSAHAVSGVIATPITAMHTVVFTPQTAIPIGGKIIISYPTSNSFSGSDQNQASPSANTYMFNGLAQATDIQIRTSLGTATCTWVLTGVTNGSNNQTPTATCTTATGIIPAGATVWVFLGCTTATSTSAGGACTAQKPLIINPANTGTRGTASVKNIQVSTQDGSSNVLDTSTLKIGTIESVFVVAHVDPTFTFTISGSASGQALNNSGSCGSGYAAITTSSTYPSTGTEVNFGTITSASNTYAAQSLMISSNTSEGYVLTATSSGFLINPGSGYYLVNAQGNVTANDTPIPAQISSTLGGYGITACDAVNRVNTTKWGTGTPLFANPSPQFHYTLVNYAGVPALGGDNIMVIYGARAASTTPPGDYWQIITYNASVIF